MADTDRPLQAESTASVPRGSTVAPPSDQSGLGLSGRQRLQRDPVERFNHKTFRTDWAALLRDLFNRVVLGCPFAVAIAGKDKIGQTERLGLRLNHALGNQQMLDFIRKHFKIRHFEHIFTSVEGMEQHERYDLYKVVSKRLGVPVNTLVYKIEHYSDPTLRALMLFGGERLEGQMETHLKVATGILEHRQGLLRRFGEHGAVTVNPELADEARTEHLISALRIANVNKLIRQKLDQRSLDELNEIVTGLEPIEPDFPAPLRAKYHTLSDFLARQGLDSRR